MKAKKKTNHFQEDADKIQQIPERKNDGRDGQDETIKAKRPVLRKNRFLAFLRKTWGRFTGCMRSCTSIQKERSAEKLPAPNGINMEEEPPEPNINMEEELPGPIGNNMEEELPGPIGNNMEEELLEPSGTKVEDEFPGPSINMEDSKAKVSTEEEEEEDDVEEKQNIDTNNVEAELVTDSFVQPARQAELRCLNDLIHRLEVLCPQYNAIHLQILAESKDIYSQSQRLLEYHIQNQIQNYSAEDQQQNREEPESRVADKIEQILKHTNDGCDGQDETIEAERPRKNQFLACLRDTWARITECMRSRTTIQKERSAEKLPTPNGINMEDSKAKVSTKEQEEEDNVEEDQNIDTNNVGTQPVTDSSVQQARQAELRRLNDLIHRLEVLYPQYNAIHLEILAENKDINSQIQRLLEYHIQNQIQNYSAEDQQQNREELESRVGDKEAKNKVDGVNGREQAGELQGKAEDNQSYKGKEKDDDKEEHTSSDDEKPLPSNICMEKPKQPGMEIPATVPLTLQSFTFHQKLGEGRYGKVYLARDIVRKESVAVKVTNKQYFIDNGFTFVERDILERSHESPYLIHGRAAFHTENCVYYVMELAPRGDLYHFMLNNRFIAHATIQFIIAEVICGVQFLHKRGIIHMDVKPGNILLTTEGHVKIADFCLSKVDAHESTNGMCAGTIKYMAPERLRCQKHGEGVDYFAIGVLMYKMYTGQHPFPGQNRNQIALAILRCTPKYPEFLTPDTVNLLQGLLHKDQHCRIGVRENIRKHPYFANINWKDVEARRVEPPAILTAESVEQNMYRTLDYKEKPNKIGSKDEEIFEEFSFICPEWSQHYQHHTAETKSWIANLFAWMFENVCPCCEAA